MKTNNKSKNKDIIYINKLIDIYGSLLTNKQLSILKDKYFLDLSLQEIADKYSISRAAILDSINQSISKLKKIDLKLNLISKYNKILSFVKDKETKEKIKNII